MPKRIGGEGPKLLSAFNLSRGSVGAAHGGAHRERRLSSGGASEGGLVHGRAERGRSGLLDDGDSVFELSATEIRGKGASHGGALAGEQEIGGMRASASDSELRRRSGGLQREEEEGHMKLRSSGARFPQADEEPAVARGRLGVRPNLRAAAPAGARAASRWGRAASGPIQA